MATAFTLTILNDSPLSFSVRIPDGDAIPVDAYGEKDYGNADWPTDVEIAEEASRQLGRVVRVQFVDRGDDLLEGIYKESKLIVL